MDWILSRTRLMDMGEMHPEDGRVYFKTVQSYADCKKVIDNHKTGAICIYTLEPEINPDAQGMMNYICGGVYALDGDISAVGENVFMVKGGREVE